MQRTNVLLREYKSKIELRIRRAPSNASALSRDSKWPGISYCEHLQVVGVCGN